MSSKEHKGKKRSKSYYRKCAYGAKRPRQGSHILEPGMKGFLVMCNNNESGAVRESYNILNEYADSLYGSDQATSSNFVESGSEEDDNDEDDDIEKALKKEVEQMKNTDSRQKRFQNVKTRANNCIFIQSMVDDPVFMVSKIMEDISQNGLKKARYAARILPILGTCKANVEDIEKLAKNILPPVFSSTSASVPSSYTIIYRSRNNNGSHCGKNEVIPAIQRIISSINPQVQYSWTDYQVAILVEIVCTTCCLGVAPDYFRLRKYNLQELQQGPKFFNTEVPKHKISTQADKPDGKTEKINKTCAEAPELVNSAQKDEHDGKIKEINKTCAETPVLVSSVLDDEHDGKIKEINKTCAEVQGVSEKAQVASKETDVEQDVAVSKEIVQSTCTDDININNSTCSDDVSMNCAGESNLIEKSCSESENV